MICNKQIQHFIKQILHETLLCRGFVLGVEI